MLRRVLNEKLRPVIEPITTGIGKAIARTHLSPNALTTIGVFAVAGCAWLMIAGRTFMAGLLLIPAFLIDVFDGALARATNRVGPWGGFYDSVADRVADATVLGAFVWILRGSPRGFVVAMIALAGTLVVPYARAKSEALGLPAPGGLGERAERAVFICAGLILGLEEAAMWAVAATTVVTFIVRVRAVRSRLRT